MAKDAALVSIIVPIYGTETYLPACLDSICEQSYSNLQIILVDDESPDGCPEICDAYAQKDSRIVVIHQKNKGVSGARNTGMRRATGEYITFVDSDDELYPNAIEVMLHDACKYNADIASAIPKQVGKIEKGVGTYADADCLVLRDEEALILSIDGAYNMNSVWSKLFRRTLIEGMYFEEGQNINEDGFFIFQCCLKKPVFVRHNITVYRYNARPNSCSRQTFSEKYFSMLFFCERKKELIAEKYPEQIERAYNMEVRTHLQFLEVLCRTNEKKYRKTHKESVKIVRRLYKYHKPINNHHKQLAWAVKVGLYSLYRQLIRLKYYK